MIPGASRARLAAGVAALIGVSMAAPGRGAGDENPGADPLETLVASERAFSAMSVEKGMKDAFLTYLADDGIIFRPLPVNGKSVWAPRRPSPASPVPRPCPAKGRWSPRTDR